MNTELSKQIQQNEASRPSWDEYFLNMVPLIRSRSTDIHTKVGCVLVGKYNQIISTGYNGVCRGVSHFEERHIERPTKYDYMEHAERNAIYNAARSGVSTDGARLYLNGIPCMDCARGIIQSGISEVIINGDVLDDKIWSSPKYTQEVCEYSKRMMEEAGVKIRFWRKADECK